MIVNNEIIIQKFYDQCKWCNIKNWKKGVV